MLAGVDDLELFGDRAGGQDEAEVGAEQRATGQPAAQPEGGRESEQRGQNLCAEGNCQQQRGEQEVVPGVEDRAEVERRAGVDEEDGHEKAVAQRVELDAHDRAVAGRDRGGGEAGDERAEHQLGADDL